MLGQINKMSESPEISTVKQPSTITIKRVDGTSAILDIVKEFICTPEGLTIKELTDLLDLSQSFVYKIAMEMKSKGIIYVIGEITTGNRGRKSTLYKASIFKDSH